MQVQQRTPMELRVRDIQTKIHGEMEHQYLTGVLDRPSLEWVQLVLADAMVRAAGLAAHVGEALVQSLVLIYHGLAVHEEIEGLAAHEDERHRQLGVLAGDYYSSKYYRLLALVGEVEMIGRFAEAIQTVNEAKAELERDPGDFSLRRERWLQLQETIHGTLLHALRTRILPGVGYWEDLVTMLVRATVLGKELQGPAAQEWRRTYGNLSVWQQATSEERKWLKQWQAGKRADHRLLSLHVKYGTSSDLFQKVDESVQLGRRAAQMLGLAGEELLELCDKLVDFRSLTPRAVEEG